MKKQYMEVVTKWKKYLVRVVNITMGLYSSLVVRDVCIIQRTEINRDKEGVYGIVR